MKLKAWPWPGKQIAIKSPGRPKLPGKITDEIINLSRRYPDWSVRTIAKAVGVSKSSVFNVLKQRSDSNEFRSR
jgi:hypothetical protein